MSLEEYKEHVRKIAYRVIGERDWCAEESNPVLKELGLPPMPPLASYTLHVPYTSVYRLPVRALGDIEAKEDFFRMVDGHGGPTLWGRNNIGGRAKVDMDAVTVEPQ